jgi:GNAT superfamily N-acetyltransferase
MECAADAYTSVDDYQVTLEEAMLGYNILVDGKYVGAIEGIPGQLEYLMVEPHWQGKGVGRAALRTFIDLSRYHDKPAVETNNALDPAMEHLLTTEGFEQTDTGWRKPLPQPSGSDDRESDP